MRELASEVYKRGDVNEAVNMLTTTSPRLSHSLSLSPFIPVLLSLYYKLFYYNVRVCSLYIPVYINAHIFIAVAKDPISNNEEMIIIVGNRRELIILEPVEAAI